MIVQPVKYVNGLFCLETIQSINCTKVICLCKRVIVV